MRAIISFVALLSLFLAIANPAVSSSNVPLSKDFQRDGEDALTSKRPVLVVFAAAHCEFCDRLEADHISPMVTSKDYDERVIIRKVMIDSYDDIKDFDGEDVSTEDFADKYGVSVTPTVMIFDNAGKRLSKKLIGYNGNEYYGWDLDKLIRKARDGMHQPL